MQVGGAYFRKAGLILVRQGMHVVLVHPNASDIYSKLEYIEIGWIFTRPGADIYFSFLKQDFDPGPNKNYAKLKKKLLDRASYHGRGNFITINNFLQLIPNLTFSNSATYHLNYIQSIYTLYACKSLHFKNKLCYHLKNTYLYNTQGLSRRDILSPVFKWKIFLPFYFRKKQQQRNALKGRLFMYTHLPLALTFMLSKLAPKYCKIQLNIAVT